MTDIIETSEIVLFGVLFVQINKRETFFFRTAWPENDQTARVLSIYHSTKIVKMVTDIGQTFWLIFCIIIE